MRLQIQRPMKVKWMKCGVSVQVDQTTRVQVSALLQAIAEKCLQALRHDGADHRDEREMLAIFAGGLACDVLIINDELSVPDDPTKLTVC